MAGIYVHIPFCVRKCDYCDFVSFTCREKAEQYVELLLREIELTAGTAAGKLRFDTVFFGGGTPSLLSGKQLARILRSLEEHFSISPDAERSMECNPGTATGDNLRAYHAAGINRLSIGL